MGAVPVLVPFTVGRVVFEVPDLDQFGIQAAVGGVFCITIIGIPFGKQCFKLAKLALMPFGATVR